MSYDNLQLGNIGNASNAVFVYDAGGDDIVTCIEPGYFNDPNSPLRTGDIIHIKSSSGGVLPVQVTKTGEEVTVNSLVWNTVPQWDDLRFPATGQNVDTNGGKLDFDYTNCGVNFAATSKYPNDPFCAVVQFPHAKKLGTEVRPHLHFEQSNAEVPNWLIEWRWVSNGEMRATYQKAAYSHASFTYVSGNLQQIVAFPPIAAPEIEKTSSVMDVRIFRDSNNTSGLFDGADPYTGEALLKEFDIHYLLDAFGSRQEFTK